MSTDLYFHAVKGISDELLKQFSVADNHGICYGHPLWPTIEEEDTIRTIITRHGLFISRRKEVGTEDHGDYIHAADLSMLSESAVDSIPQINDFDGQVISDELICKIQGSFLKGTLSSELIPWLKTHRAQRLFIRID